MYGVIGKHRCAMSKMRIFIKRLSTAGKWYPPYEILNGKYLVGKVIGIGGFGITYIGWDFYQSKKVCIKEYFPKGVAKREQTTTYSTEYSTYSMDVFTVNTKKAAYLGGLKGY